MLSPWDRNVLGSDDKSTGKDNIKAAIAASNFGRLCVYCQLFFFGACVKLVCLKTFFRSADMQQDVTGDGGTVTTQVKLAIEGSNVARFL